MNIDSDIEISSIDIKDIRFPTSKDLDGSDAMNQSPDYSAATVVIHATNTNLKGHGMTFTLGRGNEICVKAIESLAPLIVGQKLADIVCDMGKFWKYMTGDSQLRWIGPEKGAIHLATAAIINAVWDLWSKYEKKPLWKLICDMSPEELVACIDFTYISDVLTAQEAIEILKSKQHTRQERENYLLAEGFPAYTTSAGWMGYSDEKIRSLLKSSMKSGWDSFKLKVGSNLMDDKRRLQIVREEIGPDRKLMIDANQVWGVQQAIDWVNELAEYNPYFIEEPTSPDDILGHLEIKNNIKPVKVATGEHCQNRIMFKQFFQTAAIDVCQLDSCRLGGVNEVLAVFLMASKFNIPVCPHAGGVGLSEHVQHLSMVDYICISGSLDGRMIEYVDHLHEYFKYPCEVKNGSYFPPQNPGYSTEMVSSLVEEFEFPAGKFWR